MSERILIVGSGAREHAIAVALARSPQRPVLLCFAGSRNPGIDSLCAAYGIGTTTAAGDVARFAKEHAATLAIIGPEAPLAAGVGDALWQSGVPTVGPTKVLAQIESSKSFTRNLLADNGIPGNPFFRRFTSLEDAAAVIAEWSGRHVIKDDGLAGGKGVKVCGDHLHTDADSLTFCAELHAAGHAFVIEEKFEGEEFSLLSFCDGMTLSHMPAVQDHKRAYDGDMGPNTGGMGSYSQPDGSLPFLTPADIASARSINEQVAAALARTCGEPYRGVLYGGFMATADGVKLIEYNARFGDPEALNLLTLLETDFVNVCKAVTNGTLQTLEIRFLPQASVCKYVVPQGYPDDPRRGDEVVLPAEMEPGVSLYLSAVDMRHDKLVATGSRTFAAVAVADTISEAEQRCERAVAQSTQACFHRKDIGTPAAIDKRMEHMRALRKEAHVDAIR